MTSAAIALPRTVELDAPDVVQDLVHQTGTLILVLHLGFLHASLHPMRSGVVIGVVISVPFEIGEGSREQKQP